MITATAIHPLLALLFRDVSMTETRSASTPSTASRWVLVVASTVTAGLLLLVLSSVSQVKTDVAVANAHLVTLRAAQPAAAAEIASLRERLDDLSQRVATLEGQSP